MPLVTTTEMFKEAYEGGYAIGAFNVNNMEIIQGIVGAAKKLNAPVILQCSKGARDYAGLGYIVKMVDYSLEVPAVTPERTAAVSGFEGIVAVVVAGIGIGETVRIYQVDEVGGGKALP